MAGSITDWDSKASPALLPEPVVRHRPSLHSPAWPSCRSLSSRTPADTVLVLLGNRSSLARRRADRPSLVRRVLSTLHDGQEARSTRTGSVSGRLRICSVVAFPEFLARPRSGLFRAPWPDRSNRSSLQQPRATRRLPVPITPRLPSSTARTKSPLRPPSRSNSAR